MSSLHAYEEQLTSLLESLNRQIERVQAYALRVDEATRQRLSPALEKLSGEHRRLRAQIESLRQSGETDWMNQVASTQQSLLGTYLLLTSILMGMLNMSEQ